MNILLLLLGSDRECQLPVRVDRPLHGRIFLAVREDVVLTGRQLPECKMARSIGDGKETTPGAVERHCGFLDWLMCDGVEHGAFDGGFSGLVLWRNWEPLGRRELHLSGQADPEKQNKNDR